MFNNYLISVRYLHSNIKAFAFVVSDSILFLLIVLKSLIFVEDLSASQLPQGMHEYVIAISDKFEYCCSLFIFKSFSFTHNL